MIKGGVIIGVLLLIVVLLLAVSIFNNNDPFGDVLQAPKLIAQVPTPTPTLTQPLPIAPFCDNPINIGSSSEYPKISGDNIVHVSTQGASPSVYDISSGQSFNIAYTAPPSLYKEVKIDGPIILFTRIDTVGGAGDFMIYYLGNDGIPGTGDEVGPQVVRSSPTFASFFLIGFDENLVVFMDNGVTYTCTTDYPSGSCWSGSFTTVQIPPQFSTSGVVRGSTGFNGATYPYEQLFWVDSINNQFDLFYHDLVTNSVVPIANDPVLFEQLNDVSWPFMTYMATGSYQYAPPNQGTTSRIYLSLIPSPGLSFPVSSQGIGYYDFYPSVGKTQLPNGDLYISWIRHYTTSINTWDREIIVTSFPSLSEVAIPNTRNSVLGVNDLPDVDGNIITWRDNAHNMFMSKCYL